MMCNLNSPTKGFALSEKGLRQVSGVVAKGAQRARVQDALKNAAMTKNAEDAYRIVAKHLANAATVLASFPLPGGPFFPLFL